MKEMTIVDDRVAFEKASRRVGVGVIMFNFDNV